MYQRKLRGDLHNERWSKNELDIAINRATNTDARGIAQRIVFFMAVPSTALGVLYLIRLVGKIIIDGTVHSVSSPGIQIVWAVTTILLDLALLIVRFVHLVILAIRFKGNVIPQM